MQPVTERSAIDLAGAIRGGELTSEAVVEAHIALARRVGPKLNAVVADRFGQALSEARAADRRIQDARDAVARADLPSLLGVPFTVKEAIALAGMPNAAGVLARRSYRASESAPAVQRLLEAGAIPVGVTNTSELTLWIESDNRLYGRTNNPYDLKRTAGGSSGGEGAAVGAGIAPFGVGSDIAGSIRIPALFCGVFGHKPSAGLVPNAGMWPPAPAAAEQLLGVGPLARRAEDLMPILRIIASADGAAPLAALPGLGDPMSVSLAGLRVTTVEGSARVAMSAELHDGRERAVGALLAAGAQARSVRLPAWKHAAMPYLATLEGAAGPPGGRITSGFLGAAGEATPGWSAVVLGRSRHTVATRLTLAAELLPPVGEGTRTRLLAAARELASQLEDAIGDGVLLHPAHLRLAPRHGRTVGRPWLMTPAAVFNLAGVPVTEVPLGIAGNGLPVGIQVAAARGADHVAIAVAIELERVFGGWSPPAL
jgi:Asp-tRNA(Asn)/Glu-tRNA(Gln) amidotransferase A subunit family amidase